MPRKVGCACGFPALLGLVISARLASAELAGGILNVFSTPMMVVCGVFFSMDGAPRALQIAADFFPLTHLLNAARAIMLDGAGLAQLAYPLWGRWPW